MGPTESQLLERWTDELRELVRGLDTCPYCGQMGPRCADPCRLREPAAADVKSWVEARRLARLRKLVDHVGQMPELHDPETRYEDHEP